MHRSGDARAALDITLGMLKDSKNVEAEPDGFEVHDWATAKERNREPLYPNVVGYAEIARLAGASRQRAYRFPDNPTFPKPVIRTAQGPLYNEKAVESWLERRNVKPGRPLAAVR